VQHRALTLLPLKVFKTVVLARLFPEPPLRCGWTRPPPSKRGGDKEFVQLDEKRPKNAIDLSCRKVFELQKNVSMPVALTVLG